MNGSITLRPAADTDEDFLYAVYAATRSDEVAAFGWDPDAQQAFLRMQFTLRQRSYKMQFPAAEHSIITVDAAPAGRLIVNRTDKDIRLTDIAMLPAYRAKGIATFLIRQLQKEAGVAGKPIVLHVDKDNVNARSLYKALGFLVTSESDFMYEMEWHGSEHDAISLGT